MLLSKFYLTKALMLMLPSEALGLRSRAFLVDDETKTKTELTRMVVPSSYFLVVSHLVSSPSSRENALEYSLSILSSYYEY